LFQGNQSLFNTAENKLYNFYIDIKNVAEFANGSFIKSRSYDTVANTEYGHTNRIFVKKENALYVFGGYGQMKYKNEVQRYDFSKKKWEDVVVKGDYFTPRYMAAAGESGSHIYILGGYGSHSGDQLLNPGYLYDLMDFDLATHTFKKLYSLQEPDTSVVFAGSMYIDSANRCYYALCFDKSKYDTRLRLIKGSLVQPKYAFLGNAVPYAFHDVVSDADLFYSPSSRQLIAVTQLVDLGKKTTVKIFGIAFPPCPFVTDVHAKSSFLFYILPIVLILLVLVWLYFLLRKRKHAKLQPAVENKNVVAPLKSPVLAEVEYSNRVLMELTDKASFEPPSFVSERENSVQVFLFGNFEIMNAEGNEMSNLFSPLLKELFLVILLNTLKKGKGVTSEKLNDIFWENKTGKNAKNNLSVNIVRLKGILSKIGQIHIVKNGEHWEC
ncbi:MAG TPA: kelch repeat-containing protein, partial [Arachidicoccus sp.]